MSTSKLSAKFFEVKNDIIRNRSLSIFQLGNIAGPDADNYYKIDFDVFLPSIGKNLQRPKVWTIAQKQQLIISVFKDLNIPTIVAICKRTPGGAFEDR